MVRGGDRGARPARPVVGFLLEQTLGHQTHTANLQRIVPRLDVIDPVFRNVLFGQVDKFRRVPGYSNWTIRAAVRTSRAVREITRSKSIDVLFFHTQVIATLAVRWMKRVPSVVSLDATPIQYDEMAEYYNHSLGGSIAETIKRALNRRCFANAAHVVAWSDWCRDSLVEHYGVAPAKISVIPPGVDIPQWSRPADRVRDDVVRILFVGGDLERKGADDLIEAVRIVRARVGVETAVELHLVTGGTVSAAEPWLHVHHGLTPNSPALIDLYEQAAIFCIPTRADCLPMVLSEAGAAGLPVVSTRIGAIDEIVHDGDNGLMVDPGDVAGLATALERLVTDPDMRLRMGKRGEEVVAARFDAQANAARLVDVFREVAATRRRA